MGESEKAPTLDTIAEGDSTQKAHLVTDNPGDYEESCSNDEIKARLDELEALQDAVENSSENGLFKTNEKKSYEEIIDEITSARKLLLGKKPRLNEARKGYSLAFDKLNEKVNSASPQWRFIYCYAGPALTYLIVSFAVVLALGIVFNSDLLNSKLFLAPTWVFLWGTLGGILSGFWSIWKHVSDKDFRNVWYVWYLVLPFVGALLGAFTYLIFSAGFIAFTGQTQMNTQFFAMLLSGLAGFSSKWAADLFDQITSLIKINKK